MNSSTDNYEKVSIYQLDPDDREKLLTKSRECTFNWSTRDGWPMGVIMSCLWRDNRLWLTASAHRHRIAAVKRDNRVSVVLSSTATGMGRIQAITIKGRCALHEDNDLKNWFYKAFSSHMYEDKDEAAQFMKMLDSPLRTVIEVIPEKFITYDGDKMLAHAKGDLDESRLSEPLEADTKRLASELKKRGLET